MKNRHGKPENRSLLREGWGGRTECVPERSGGMERKRNPDQPGPEPLAEGHAQKNRKREHIPPLLPLSAVKQPEHRRTCFQKRYPDTIQTGCVNPEKNILVHHLGNNLNCPIIFLSRR